MKKLFFIKIILIFCFFLAFKIEATSIIFDSPKTVVSQDEEFYVDLLLDAEGQFINGIEGNVSFIGGDLSFVRSLEAKSIMDLWIKKPEIEKFSINFSAVSTYGFSGVIDPFNQDEKLPGLVTRLFFKPSISGEVLFTTPKFIVTLDDGHGTMIEVAPISYSFFVTDEVYVPEITNEIVISEPEIQAYVVQDKNLYNNKYVLIFEAKDDETGIDKVLIKEGRRKWKEIESPYLLKDQSRQSLINIQALNFSGQSSYLIIDPLSTKSRTISAEIYVLAFLFIFLVFIFIKRIYPSKK
jgi:hypothetical protein